MNDGHNLGNAQLVRTTDKAILVSVDELIDSEWEGEIWVPKSVVHDDSEVYSGSTESGDLIVKTWWAEDKGYA